MNYHVSLRAQVTSADSAGPIASLAASVFGRQKRLVSRRTGWDRRSPAGLEKVTAAVIAAAGARAGDQVLDIGCGAGSVSLPLAEDGARVLAIDPSQLMVGQLEVRAQERALIGFECLAMPIERLSLPAESVDVIVSSYALHYLRDVDKGRLVAAAYHWLRPGGTLVLADMMFGRGTTSEDRAIIRTKVGSLAKKGVGGWWRIAKNGYRYLVRAQERPVTISTWATMLARAGFKHITASSIVNEAGLVSGKRPVTGQAAVRVPRQPGAAD